MIAPDKMYENPMRWRRLEIGLAKPFDAAARLECCDKGPPTGGVRTQQLAYEPARPWRPGREKRPPALTLVTEMVLFTM